MTETIYVMLILLMMLMIPTSFPLLFGTVFLLAVEVDQSMATTRTRTRTKLLLPCCYRNGYDELFF